MSWKPIESAPRDGTWFLGYNPDSYMAWKPYEFVSWTHHYDKNPATGQWDVKIEPGYYCEVDTSEVTECTHWQPLPSPPEE